MQLKQGSLLQGGKYRIECVLGQGGFGITYRAMQVTLMRPVAIKEFFMKDFCNRNYETSNVFIGSQGSAETVERFRHKFIKEARNIAKLKHRNVISVIDIFEENGTAYYVMEHVDGGSLADKVAHTALPEAVAVRYIRQVAQALALVHSKHMMHLDVKPANILIDEDDNAVLIDFGLSKQYDEEGHQTSTTPVGLSHGYAPMEQYRRGGVSKFSPASDIYSLGATLFKLVTGERPPEAGDIINDGLPEFPHGISLRVRNAIEVSMRYVIKERPQSVDEFLALLDNDNTVNEIPSGCISEETRINEKDFSISTQVDSDESTHVKEKPKNYINIFDDERFKDLKLKPKEKGKLKLFLATVIPFLIVVTIMLVIWKCGNENRNVYSHSHNPEVVSPSEDSTKIEQCEVSSDVSAIPNQTQEASIASDKAQNDSIAEQIQREELEAEQKANRQKAIAAARVALNSCLVDGNANFQYFFFFNEEHEMMSDRDKKILAKMSDFIKYSSYVRVIGLAPSSENYGYMFAEARARAVSEVLSNNGTTVHEITSQSLSSDSECPYRSILSLEGVAFPLYVFFGKSSTSLSQKDILSLTEFARSAAHGGYKLVVRAFSGTEGGLALSRKRADAVSAVLRRNGANVSYPNEYAFEADGLTPALSDNCVIISFE